MHVRWCLLCQTNWAVAARRKYPNTPILATKTDYKSAYHHCHLNASMAVQSCTQLLTATVDDEEMDGNNKDDLALIMLRLTFGGTPCPSEWGVIL